MHLGVQRLYPPIHHLGETGEVGYVTHRRARAGDQLGGPASRHQFDPEPRQGLGEILHAALIEDAEQRAPDRNDGVWAWRRHEAPAGFEGVPRRAAALARAPRWYPISSRQSRGRRSYRRNGRSWKARAL